MRASRPFRTLLMTLGILVLSAASFAQVSISVSIGPPPLPVYEQPVCPGDGYIWTPGYWAYGPDGYYWIPGTWVLAPQPGFLWTPPWWGWSGAAFIFHDGYWGPHVGFYGGIVYGFGYFGHGFEGGRWQGDHFFYNRSVTNINVVNVHNVYNTTINNVTVNHVSYNGGNGGIEARPSAEEQSYDREHHVGPTAAQTQHYDAARSNPQMRVSENRGKPPVAATARPGGFNEREATPAREAGSPYRPEVEHAANAPGGGRNVPRPPTDAKDLTPHERPPAPNTGDANLDKKYQQQQDKLYQKQEQEHQKMAQQQEKDHQKLAQQNAKDEQRQQVEQRHAQQTQQMEQKHQQQWNDMQTRQAPASHGGGGHPK